MVNHQFYLFGFSPISKKVPISKERILEAKAQLSKGDMKGVLKSLISIREKLESFEKRLSNGNG